MAWEVGGGTLNPGESARWWYSWGDYHGPQMARGRPLNPGSELVISEESEKEESGGSYSYFVTITNTGSYPVNYNLTGGGV